MWCHWSLTSRGTYSRSVDRDIGPPHRRRLASRRRTLGRTFASARHCCLLDVSIICQSRVRNSQNLLRDRARLHVEGETRRIQRGEVREWKPEQRSGLRATSARVNSFETLPDGIY